MEYAIAIAAVVIIVGAGITFGLFKMMRRGGEDPKTPLGDTTEHSEVPSDEDAPRPDEYEGSEELESSQRGEKGGEGRYTGSREAGFDPSS